MHNNNYLHQLFVCFAAEDRYNIAQPIVYHLKNYGICVWYDRYSLLLGDNRKEKNLNKGAAKCEYALTILSRNTVNSACAMEELSVIKSRYYQGKATVFPVLYEISPTEIPSELCWIKELIFKEVNKHSGTREICNHIACKITEDILSNYSYQGIIDIINANSYFLPLEVNILLQDYQDIDYSNLNSRITLLYAIYIIIYAKEMRPSSNSTMVSKIFERLFSETRLKLHIDYRELWLLENAICILINDYLAFCTESNI